MPSPHPRQSSPATQPELSLDHTPSLEQSMRSLFELRWRRWHRTPDYDEAVKDPITKRLLLLAVQHMPGTLAQPRRTERCKPKR